MRFSVKYLEKQNQFHIFAACTTKSDFKPMKLPTNRKVNIYEEANRCLLCQNAPCTKACKTGDPARAIRAIRFDKKGLTLKPVRAGLGLGRGGA